MKNFWMGLLPLTILAAFAVNNRWIAIAQAAIAGFLLGAKIEQACAERKKP